MRIEWSPWYTKGQADDGHLTAGSHLLTQATLVPGSLEGTFVLFTSASPG